MIEPRAALAVPFLDLASEHRDLLAEMREAMDRVVAHGQFILGPEVDRFEQDFAAFVGAAAGIGVSSGLDALRLALMALDIGAGAEVILPANTFIATALAVSAVGATPVLVDCRPDTFNIDPERVEAAVTPRTRAIMAVHLTGLPADMDSLLDIGRRRGVPVIEDAAQAHGSLYHDRPCGSLGLIGCFSFYPGKNLGAFGDAGMVVTKDPALAARLRQLRNYGQTKKYEHVSRGLNARLDTLQAAVLAVKLSRVASWNAARRRHASRYRELLAGVGDLAFQVVPGAATPNYHLFMVLAEQRDALRSHLERARISTNIHYPIPIHLQAAYQDLACGPGSFPVSERLARTTLSLPMYATLRDDQLEAVADAIRAFPF